MLLIINRQDLSPVWGWGISMAFLFIPIVITSVLTTAYYLIRKEKTVVEIKLDIILLVIVILQNISLFLSIPRI